MRGRLNRWRICYNRKCRVKVDILMGRTNPQIERATLSIGDVVAALESEFPDVSRSSLRFLEREGLITAKRTSGGHRLYAAADVDRVRQIKTWQAQRLSLQQIRKRLADLDQMPEADALSERFLALASAGNRAAAQALILSADDVGMPMLRLFGDVMQPALYEAGRQWERGELTVAQEKEISELARELIIELTNRHVPAVPDGPVVVAASVEGERHELGLRMISGLLRTLGYRVHFLGGDVAPRFLVEAAHLRRPNAILLSATLESHLFAVRDMTGALRAALDDSLRPRVVVGGEAVQTKSDQIIIWGGIPITNEPLGETMEEVQLLVPLHSSAQAERE